MMRNNKLAARFVRYHLNHPEVWETYKTAILTHIDSGRGSGGVKAITEEIRWGTHHHLVNDFDPFYSRLFAHAHPHLADFFSYKRSAADYIDYECLMLGDAKGALNWVDPQLELKLA